MGSWICMPGLRQRLHMPAQPARFPAPAAVDPWGSAGGQAAWSSSAPSASGLVRWDQKPEGNPNRKRERQAKDENTVWTKTVFMVINKTRPHFCIKLHKPPPNVGLCVLQHSAIFSLNIHLGEGNGWMASVGLRSQ